MSLNIHQASMLVLLADRAQKSVRPLDSENQHNAASNTFVVVVV